MKRRTRGFDFKALIGPVVTIILYFLARYGIELPEEVSGALATILGVLAAVLGPAPETYVLGDHTAGNGR